MSRVDQAWRRASAGEIRHWEVPLHPEHEQQTGCGLLNQYPPESGICDASVEIRDRSSARTLAPLRPSERRPSWRPPRAIEPKLVVSGRANPVAVEQYRRLAGTLHEIQVEQGLKTLMVTSALPNEGKTLSIVNLALTLSESCERRVLLIDADLRRPFLHEIFQLPNTEGLTDVLRSDAGELPRVQVTEHLSVLPAGGGSQPMADLTSKRLGVLLERWAASFDWVLLDAAPVGFMPDAHLLARLTRAVLFVIAANSTPQQLISRAITELDPDRVVGILFNRVAQHNIPAAGYYQDYYARADAE